jgi:hypothetical protein
MGRIFESETTVFYRLFLWAKDCTHQILALPDYINPKPLQSAPLTEEDKKFLDELTNEEFCD